MVFDSFRQAAMLQSSLLSHVGGYLGGEWVGMASDQAFAVRNPLQGDLLAHVPDMGAAQTTTAVLAAAQAVQTPLPLERRRESLLGLADLLDRHKPELARIITLENGKPIKESTTEVDYARGFFVDAAQHLPRLLPRTLEQPIRNCHWTIFHRPAGVVGLITPWNFPLAMLAKKLSAALAAGCGIVAKPAEKTPLTLIALWHLLEQLHLPPGTANLVVGQDPRPIVQVLMDHPQVRLISFTGSTEVGRQLIAQSAPGIKRLALELGGNAPYLVFDDADLDLAADALLANKFRAGGQTCVCANRIYVHKAIADDFAQRVVQRVAQLKMGDGLDPATDLGPLIDRHGFDKVSRHVADALAKGAQLLLGGSAQPPSGDWGCFYPATVLTAATQDMLLSQEETFGPLLPIATFDSDAEALRLANNTPFGLAAYLFTQDPDRARCLVAALHFGHVALNSGTGPIPQAPFGGMKQSGFGREGGEQGPLEYCEVQALASALP